MYKKIIFLILFFSKFINSSLLYEELKNFKKLNHPDYTFKIIKKILNKKEFEEFKKLKFLINNNNNNDIIIIISPETPFYFKINGSEYKIQKFSEITKYNLFNSPLDNAFYNNFNGKLLIQNLELINEKNEIIKLILFKINGQNEFNIFNKIILIEKDNILKFMKKLDQKYFINDDNNYYNNLINFIKKDDCLALIYKEFNESFGSKSLIQNKLTININHNNNTFIFNSLTNQKDENIFNDLFSIFEIFIKELQIIFNNENKKNVFYEFFFNENKEHKAFYKTLKEINEKSNKDYILENYQNQLKKIRQKEETNFNNLFDKLSNRIKFVKNTYFNNNENNSNDSSNITNNDNNILCIENIKIESKNNNFNLNFTININKLKNICTFIKKTEIFFLRNQKRIIKNNLLSSSKINNLFLKYKLFIKNKENKEIFDKNFKKSLYNIAINFVMNSDDYIC